MSEERRERLAGRYEELLGVFELQWNRHGHQSVHFGYYDEAHTDAGEAMLNNTRELADAAGVEPGDRVLDVGCGAGGDAVWLATERDADVVGVDLVEPQLERAQEQAIEAGVEDRVTLWRDDFHELVAVEDDSIDVAMALESLSHSATPPAALASIRDALVPGGRLAIGDVFLRTADPDPAVESVLAEIEANMGLQFRPLDSFVDALGDAGFEHVEYRDVTSAIEPGAEQSRGSSELFGSVASIGSVLGLGSDAAASYFDFWSDVYELLDADVAGYYHVRAQAAGDDGDASEE